MTRNDDSTSNTFTGKPLFFDTIRSNVLEELMQPMNRLLCSSTIVQVVTIYHQLSKLNGIIDKISMDSTPTASTKVDGAHSDNIWSLSWTTDGKILTGSLDGTVKLWSLSKDAELVCEGASPKHHVGVTSLASVSDGSISIACYQDSKIKMFSTENMNEISSIDPGLLEAWSVSTSPNDEIIVSGTARGIVNVWSMLHGHEKISEIDAKSEFILGTAFNVDSRLAISGSDGVVSVLDIESKGVIHRIEEHAVAVRSVVFSPYGNILLMASDDKHVSVFDLVSGSIFCKFSMPAMARSIDISQDMRHFVVGCADGSVAYMDLGMQKTISSYETHKEQVWCVGFDKSSKTRFASSGDDALLQLYQ
jgi:WD40 repeat protein